MSHRLSTGSFKRTQEESNYGEVGVDASTISMKVTEAQDMPPPYIGNSNFGSYIIFITYCSTYLLSVPTNLFYFSPIPEN